jgi:ubiquinone/menaquinone biosynthesis C-methylase UbiE
MERQVVPELLDGDAGTPQQVRDSLADLQMLNRWFGGAATTTSLLRRVARQRSLSQLSFLDVAGASGDIATAARSSLERRGITLKATVLDQAFSHLTSAAEMPAICGTALALPFRDQSFDVVGCSLFLHHLEPADIVHFAREAMRCARYAVILNDLRRSFLHLLAAKAGRLIYRSPLTRHDAPASVRRAYTPAEVGEILIRAGYPHAEFSHHYFFRMAVLIWRKEIP